MKRTATRLDYSGSVCAKFAGQDCVEMIQKSRNKNKCDEDYFTDEAKRLARRAFRHLMYSWAKTLDLSGSDS
jgi:hypothetical protein